MIVLRAEWTGIPSYSFALEAARDPETRCAATVRVQFLAMPGVRWLKSPATRASRSTALRSSPS